MDALPESVKNDDKITFLTYDSEEDIYLIVDTIISYSKTWSSVKISTELAKKINSSDVYTKTEVMSLINAKVASALKYKGAVATTAALPSSGQENGDSYYVQADGYMYAWSDDYSDWQALGSATDMTDYYTKSEVDAIAADLAVKFQFTSMPTADSTTVGKIIQYTGADTNDYKNGYWYKGIDNGDSTYSWTVYTDGKYATKDDMHDLLNSGNEYALDLNSALEPGTYYVGDFSINRPSNYTYGILIVYGRKTDTPSATEQWIIQEFHDTVNNDVLIRSSINSSSLTPTNWSSWQKLATTSEIASINEKIPSDASASNMLLTASQANICHIPGNADLGVEWYAKIKCTSGAYGQFLLLSHALYCSFWLNTETSPTNRVYVDFITGRNAVYGAISIGFDAVNDYLYVRFQNTVPITIISVDKLVYESSSTTAPSGITFEDIYDADDKRLVTESDLSTISNATPIKVSGYSVSNSYVKQGRVVTAQFQFWGGLSIGIQIDDILYTGFPQPDRPFYFSAHSTSLDSISFLVDNDGHVITKQNITKDDTIVAMFSYISKD